MTVNCSKIRGTTAVESGRKYTSSYLVLGLIWGRGEGGGMGFSLNDKYLTLCPPITSCECNCKCSRANFFTKTCTNYPMNLTSFDERNNPRARTGSQNAFLIESSAPCVFKARPERVSMSIRTQRTQNISIKIPSNSNRT